MQTIFYKDFLLRFLKNQNFAVVFCRYNKSKVSKEGYSPWTRLYHLKKVTAQWLQRNACRKGLQNVDSQRKVRKLEVLCTVKTSHLPGEKLSAIAPCAYASFMVLTGPIGQEILLRMVIMTTLEVWRHQRSARGISCYVLLNGNIILPITVMWW